MNAAGEYVSEAAQNAKDAVVGKVCSNVAIQSVSLLVSSR
jgi:hypothetical protein